MKNEFRGSITCRIKGCLKLAVRHLVCAVDKNVSDSDITLLPL